jgi:DNA-binding MarR family transcriptional regulator
MTLAEYAALLQLAESPGRRLRMNQLADGIVLSRSGVTRLIDRLEADGLVARSQCPSDGRGAEAVLTDDGLSRLRQASRTHLRGIEAYFLANVEPVDLAAIERSCGAIRQRVRGDERADAPGTASTPQSPSRQPLRESHSA